MFRNGNGFLPEISTFDHLHVKNSFHKLFVLGTTKTFFFFELEAFSHFSDELRKLTLVNIQEKQKTQKSFLSGHKFVGNQAVSLQVPPLVETFAKKKGGVPLGKFFYQGFPLCPKIFRRAGWVRSGGGTCSDTA